MKTIHVRYNTLLAEQCGLAEELVRTEAENPVALFEELRKKYGFRFGCGIFKVIINNEMQALFTPLNDGDEVTFHPPMAGG